MIIRKFNPADPLPEYIKLEVLTPPDTMAHFIYFTEGGSDRIFVGDYIKEDRGKITLIRAAQYAAELHSRRTVVAGIAMQLMEDIIQGFEDLPVQVTDAQKIAILRHVGPCQDMIIANKLVAALRIAEALPLTAEFTSGRKAGYVLLIQTAVNQL